EGGRARAGGREIDNRDVLERQLHQRVPAGRIAEPVCEAGLRRVHVPVSTAARKSSTARLNASGSSRLIVWPDFGMTTSAAVGILRFMKIAGSRHGSSSSPVMISVGTSSFSSRSPRSKIERSEEHTSELQSPAQLV